jgi:predicted AAA+ superfamily ATPase
MRVARITAAQLELRYRESFGAFLEAFVAAELWRQRTWSELDYEIFRYRDRDGLEVDLILELSGGGVIAIEVKGSIGFHGDHFKGLRKLRDELGDQFVAGFVLNAGHSGYSYANRLYGLPVAALWRL